LNAGLPYCRHNLIFRMDADDVSLPDRFQKQVQYFVDNPNVSMIGGYYRQYDSDMDLEVGERRVPLTFAEIKRYARRRTPINHVTIGFKKDAAIHAGGYPNTRYPFEDWWLSLRFIRNNLEIVNIPEYLVSVRSGREFYLRRRGLAYLSTEMATLLLLRKERLLSGYHAWTNIFLRAPLRLLPSGPLGWLYKQFLRGQ
jgi:hypothetical protein